MCACVCRSRRSRLRTRWPAHVAMIAPCGRNLSVTHARVAKPPRKIILAPKNYSRFRCATPRGRPRIEPRSSASADRSRRSKPLRTGQLVCSARCAAFIKHRVSVPNANFVPKAILPFIWVHVHVYMLGATSRTSQIRELSQHHAEPRRITPHRAESSLNQAESS